jgi:hypothetical protein
MGVFEAMATDFRRVYRLTVAIVYYQTMDLWSSIFPNWLGLNALSPVNAHGESGLDYRLSPRLEME